VKKFTLILVLVILISLTVVMPVFAGGGDHGKACENITDSGWFWGWRQGNMQNLKFGEVKGRFYGPGHAYFNVCK
jgi:hypothetical protein